MHLDSSSFEVVRNHYDQFDTMREKVISASRPVIKLSKQVIYSIHRGDMGKAKTLMADMTEAVKVMKSSSKTPELQFSGVMRSALQEYVEAAALLELLDSGNLPTADSLEVDGDSFLLGMCDLVGELGRIAVAAATAKDLTKFKDIHDFVLDLQGELIKFNLRNSELRRKYDSVKYTVKKLEDMAFDLRDDS